MVSEKGLTFHNQFISAEDIIELAISGMILVFVETLIVFFKPSLDKSFIFSMIWFFLICIFANGTLLFCFLSRVSHRFYFSLPELSVTYSSHHHRVFQFVSSVDLGRCQSGCNVLVRSHLTLSGLIYIIYLFVCPAIRYIFQVVIVVAFGIIIPIYILTAIIATVVSCICRWENTGNEELSIFRLLSPWTVSSLHLPLSPSLSSRITHLLLRITGITDVELQFRTEWNMYIEGHTSLF